MTNLYKCNKDILIKLLLEVNNLNNLTDDELLKKKEEIDDILFKRECNNRNKKEKERILSNNYLQKEYSIFKEEANLSDNQNSYELIDEDSHQIKLKWNSNNPVDVQLIYKNKLFFPTDECIAQCDGIKFLHYCQEIDLYCFIIIFKGKGNSKDPYKGIRASKVDYLSLFDDEYYIPHKEFEWVYLNKINFEE